MGLILSEKIMVKDSPIEGRGVFAISDMSAGEIIEECHHVPLSQKFSDIDNKLKEYVFSWPKSNGRCSTVVLGFGSIYNHSKTPNIDWDTDEERNIFIFKTIRDIKAGEELCSNYGEGYETIIKTVN